MTIIQRIKQLAEKAHLGGLVSAKSHGTREQREQILSSGLFDAEFYEKQLSRKLNGVDPLEHYLTQGEKRNLRPSAHFDPVFYRRQNDDVRRSGSGLLLHYVLFGQPEGRHPMPPKVRINAPIGRIEEPAELAEMHAPNVDELRGQRVLIESSGLFDAGFYLGQAGEKADIADPLGDYLLRGEPLGLKPTADFDPVFYGERYPDVLIAGISPFLHYVSHGRAEGRKALPTSEIDGQTEQALLVNPILSETERFVLQSGVFDGDVYRQQTGLDLEDEALIVHYFKTGEAAGLKPAVGFDPGYYARRYPDVPKAGMNCFAHYVSHGRHEGRWPASPMEGLTIDAAAFDRSKKTYVVLAHEASRTGAPILGLNIAENLRLHQDANVCFVSRSGGELEHELTRVVNQLIVFPKNYEVDELDAQTLAEKLLKAIGVSAVICNSVETRRMGIGMRRAGIPLLALVHEFSSYTKPRGSLRTLYEVADEIVFPAALVRDSSLKDYPWLKFRDVRILPQGPSRIPAAPPKGSKGRSANLNIPATSDAAFPLGDKGTLAKPDFHVVGLGFVDWRKGCDLFVAAAAQLQRQNPQLNFRFTWVGGGFGDHDHIDISVYVREQIERSGVSARVFFEKPVADMTRIYAMADMLFLSSRLDPLPNVAIDAALLGLPIVCFDQGSGMAEILLRNPVTAALVAPYLDIGAAVRCMEKFVFDPGWRHAVRLELTESARALFDMKKYVAQLVALAAGADAQADADAIQLTEVRDYLESLPYRVSARNLSDAELSGELLQMRHVDASQLPMPRYYGRKLVPGFNPYRYAQEAASNGWTPGRSPLVHYIESGAPSGPWANRVLALDAVEERSAHPQVAARFRVALHLHLFYEELAEDLLPLLSGLPAGVHLFITSDTQEKIDAVVRTLQPLGLAVTGMVCKNAGRDVFPFLEILRAHGHAFDVVGHLHGKKSISQKDAGVLGNAWRNFLYGGLLGRRSEAASKILNLLEAEPDIGLVFPDDPHLIGWEGNRAVAEALLERMDLGHVTLAHAIDFPVGTMFWARTEALSPLLRLALTAEECPAEPVPDDGTLLHALERLLPVIAAAQGFRYATTYSMLHTR
jgi:glycosyltransferase involved in cell wall biosynthesis